MPINWFSELPRKKHFQKGNTAEKKRKEQRKTQPIWTGQLLGQIGMSTRQMKWWEEKVSEIFIRWKMLHGTRGERTPPETAARGPPVPARDFSIFLNKILKKKVTKGYHLEQQKVKKSQVSWVCSSALSEHCRLTFSYT